MEYVDKKVLPTQKREVKSPLADHLKALTDIPAPTVSTREHFKTLDIAEMSGNILEVPMDVGLEMPDGSIVSIWHIEKLRAALGVNEKLPFKPFIKVAKEEEGDSDKNYTYINEDTEPGFVGTNGARFKVPDLSPDAKEPTVSIVLHWALTRANVPSLPNDAKYMVNDKGVLLTAIGEFSGTILSEFHENLNHADIQEELPNIIYVKQNLWYWLPLKQPMNNRQLLGAFKGKYKTLIGYDDSTGADSTRFNADMEQALIVYLSSKVVSFSAVTYTSSYNIEEEVIATRGDGYITFKSPRAVPSPNLRIPYPPNHKAIEAIWLDRLPLDLIMNIIMIKGFEITSDYRKKSVIIGAMPSNYGKTTLYAKAMINNNLLVTVKFSRLVDTIGEGDKVGSIPLSTLYKKAVILADEASDMEDVPKHLATGMIKDIATGSVSGAVKNQLESKIDNFPPFQMMARDDMQNHMRTLSDNDELDNRTLFPVFGKGTAGTDFAEYSETDTLDSLQCSIYDMFYEKYNKLKSMSPEMRVTYMDSIFELEEEIYDRERVRLEAKTLPILAAVDIAANTLYSPNSKFSRLVPNGTEHVAVEDYAFVDNKGGVLVARATTYEHGIHAHLKSMLEHRVNFKAIVERADFSCVADLRHRVNRTARPVESREEQRTKGSFYIPLDRTDIPRKVEVFNKYALSKIKSDVLIKAFEEKDIVPFLARLMKNTSINKSLITLIVGMQYHWSVEAEAAEVYYDKLNADKGEDDDFSF